MAQPVPLVPERPALRAADVPVIILAGGLGTRLRTVVNDRPKVLAPVAGRPFLSYLLEQVESAGFRQVVLGVGYLADQIEAEYGTRYGQLHIRYSVEQEALGTAGAIRLAATHCTGDLCLAMNGDSYINVDLNAFLEWHLAQGTPSSLLLTRVEDAGRYGTVAVTEDGQITAFMEKQGIAQPGWINAGIYLLSRAHLDSVPAGWPVSIERDCFPRWVGEGLGGYRQQAAFIDIGTPESFGAAAAFLAGLGKARPTTPLTEKVVMSSTLIQANAGEVIRNHFTQSAAVKQQAIEACTESILAAAEIIASVLKAGSKILLCGNGGSAADSQHIAAEFVSVLTQDYLRPGLPAIALTVDSSVLTASANDFGFAGIFERQVQALGQPGDVLIGISTSGNSENVLRAMNYAKAHGVKTVAWVGGTGGKMAGVADVTICVPSNVTQYVQESHIAIGHILCHLVERAVMPATTTYMGES
jgi:phosphoheptose isomerase